MNPSVIMSHICENCRFNFDSLQLYANHFKQVHPNLKRFVCTYKQCERVYSNLRKHIDHIKEVHYNSNKNICTNIKSLSTTTNISPSTSCELTTINQISILDQISLLTAEKNSVSSNYISASSSNYISTNRIKLILKILDDDRVPRTTAFSFFKNIFTFYDKHIFDAKTILEESQNSFSERQISILTSLLSPNYVKSEFLILKHLKQMSILVDFDNIKLGSEFNQTYSNANTIKIVQSDYFMQVVNLKQLFTTLFTQTSILDIILEYIKHIETLCYTVSNIVQTTYWKQKTSQFNPQNESNVLLIPLLIYFDDFEYLNPLGSHSGVQKVGAVYIKIMCLPEYVASKLSHIFLAMLFFTEDRKKFGNNLIFKVLIDQLNNLQNEGINISYKNYTNIKLIPCAITGDNLGLNSILGFTESFNSLHYCRFCRCNNSDMKTQLFEKVDYLRNVSNYVDDVNLNNINSTGVKEDSIWNTLKNFHVTENFSVDCMHDILEGICHYDLSVILRSFILKKKYFSLHKLNQRIEMFNFGLIAQKPPLLNSDALSKDKFKMSASEMLTFVINLPLIIGDLIPNDSIEWELFLSLREIVSLVFRKTIHINSTKYIKELVSYHNSLYIKVSLSHLKPKFHHLTHYERVIEKIGPISAISSMRFEAKHQTLKKSGYISNNRINILKTMHIKYQLKMANFFLNYGELCNSSITHGKRQTLDNTQFEKYHLKSSEKNKIFKTSWLNYQNLFLKSQMVVCVDLYENEEPMFGLIEYLISCDENYYICYELLETQFFDRHYFAYKVLKTNKFLVCNLENLKCWHTSHVSACANGNQFIIWDF